jgi:hypothetical protein
MLKSVLMAASRLAASQIPTPRQHKHIPTPLNAVLGNTLNFALNRARKFNENCNQLSLAQLPLTASG